MKSDKITWSDLQALKKIQRSVPNSNEGSVTNSREMLSVPPPRSTHHFQKRSKQRSISEDDIRTVITHGEQFHYRGAHAIAVRLSVLKLIQKEQLKNIVIIANEDGTLITTYHRTNAWSHLKKNNKVKSRGHSSPIFIHN